MAVACFTHGLAHLIAEMGVVDEATAWAAGAVVALGEARGDGPRRKRVRSTHDGA